MSIKDFILMITYVFSFIFRVFIVITVVIVLHALSQNKIQMWTMGVIGMGYLLYPMLKITFKKGIAKESD